MTREELRGHCERQIQQFERVEKIMPVTLNDWKRYEEHKLILELLEQESILDKIKAEIDKPIIRDEYSQRQNDYCDGCEFVCNQIREIIDKYKAERVE